MPNRQRAEQKSDAKLTIRMTEAELETIKKQAKDSGIKVSELIRGKVLGEVASQPASQSPPPPRPPSPHSEKR